MPTLDVHFEPYVYVAGLTPTSVLLAWGGFYFRRRGDTYAIVDDEQLAGVAGDKRKETIGKDSEPFGDAEIEVRELGGKLAARATVGDRNWTWISGLRPDTEYEYRIFVEDAAWAEGPRADWVADGPDGGRLATSGRRYDFRFRTHPSPEQAADLSFLLLGDFGVGIRGPSDAARRQRRVAKAFDRALELYAPRLLLTVGDNIYHLDKRDPEQGSGDEDDDWFFTYYQPYRYLLGRIPVYPSVGNHDTGDTECSDDRAQLVDNFFLDERFQGDDCSIHPGLFYRLTYGKDIELVCLDTSLADELPEQHYFQHAEHAAFLERAFPAKGSTSRAPAWQIPFCHHPPFCAGPRHCNTEPLIECVVPLLERAGVRAMFSGHEHNFQYSEQNGVHYFLSGAGGRLREEPPTEFEAAHTRAFAVGGHGLLVEVSGPEMRVRPLYGVGDDGELRDLELKTPEGARFASPIRVRLE